MVSYTQAAMERTMKVQEVILRAMAKKITWWQAAEILGLSDRSMRRWRERGPQKARSGALATSPERQDTRISCLRSGTRKRVRECNPVKAKEINWRARRDSNSRPTAPEAAALSS